jgi:hypothetical protein
MEQEENTALKVMVCSIVVMSTLTGFWAQVGSNKEVFSHSSCWNLPVQTYERYSYYYRRILYRPVATLRKGRKSRYHTNIL